LRGGIGGKRQRQNSNGDKNSFQHHAKWLETR